MKIIKRLLWGLLGLSLVLNLLIKTDYTSGNSMYPTLKNGQMVLSLSEFGMRALGQDYQYGDIVLVKTNSNNVGIKDGTLIVKRIIGRPNDSIGFTRTTVLRNGQQLTEPYVKLAMDNLGYQFPGGESETLKFRESGYVKYFKLSDHSYFVMGDNRPGSLDSRYLGPMSKSQFRGKVVLKLPFNYNVIPQRFIGLVIQDLPIFLSIVLILLTFGRAKERFGRKDNNNAAYKN